MPVQAFIHSSHLYTGKGVAAKGGRRPKEEDLEPIADGAVVFESGGRILWTGSTSDLPKKYRRVRKKNLAGAKAIVPSFVECHTHSVFAGDRAEEFSQRCGGVSYEEIAKRGGGIISTLRATRQASPSLLEKLAAERVKTFKRYGVRTLEIKSGYGLDFESELKCLAVVARLRHRFPDVTFVSTFLGAHAFPPEKGREEYVSEIVDRMLPEIAKRKLADCCDVFIDQGYFTLHEGQKILERAKALGLKLKVHADELYNTESASLAVRLGALSADHLLKISDRGIRDLAKSDTVGVLLPATAFYLKAEYAPARKLIDAGACIALSTDFNPGSSMTQSLPAVMTLAALYMGMTRAEIFSGVTYNAAKALGLEKRKGVLAEGYDADINVLPFRTFEETYYRFAW